LTPLPTPTAVNVPLDGANAASAEPQHTSVPSTRIAQLPVPAATATNAPVVGAPLRGYPQHAMLSSLRIAHVLSMPADTMLKVPAGGDASPDTSCPQHASVPSSRTAQPWRKPRLSCVNAPDGGESRPSASNPQHSMAPLGRIPHDT